MSKPSGSDNSWLSKTATHSQPNGQRSGQFYPPPPCSPAMAWQNQNTNPAMMQPPYNTYGSPFNAKPQYQQEQHSHSSGASAWDWDVPQNKNQQFHQVPYQQQQQQFPQQQQFQHPHQQPHSALQLQQQHHSHHPHQHLQLDHHHQPQQHQPQQHQRQQQQQQQQHQQQQEHQQQHNFNDYATYSQNTNADPWNWGWDESHNFGEPVNNNSSADPSWNWSVDGSAAYQSNLSLTDNNSQHRTGSPSSTSLRATPQPVHQPSYGTPDVVQTASHHFQLEHGSNTVPGAMNTSSNVVDNSLEGSFHYSYFSPVNKEFFPKTESDKNEDSNNVSSHPIDQSKPVEDQSVNNVFNEAAESPDSKVHEANATSSHGDILHDLAVHGGGVTKETEIKQTGLLNDKVWASGISSNGKNDIHGIVELKEEPLDFVGNPVEAYQENGSVNLSFTPDLKPPESVQEVPKQRDEFHKQIDVPNSAVLTPQWSTESIPSQASEESLPPGDTGAATGGNSHPHENKGDYKSELAMIGGPSHSQWESETGTDVSRKQIHSELGTADNKRLNIHGKADQQTLDSKTPDSITDSELAASAEAVANAFGDLSLTSNTSNVDVENVEIVPPETSRALRTVYGHIEGTAAGIAPTSTPVSLGMGSKTIPYLSNIGHKQSAKYQQQSTVNDSSSSRNFGLVVSLPEMSSSTSSKGELKRRRPLDDHTEDTVNLETVPDNKERPDFVEMQQPVLERKSVSPMSRVHTVPVGQDAAVCQAVPWNQGQQSQPNYTSPENQEVAPVSASRIPGPDRDQYLETGQLTEETPTPPPGLHRMVPGEGGAPPPGLRRMVPGESSSPDSPLPSATASEARVVTGVARDDSLQLPTQLPGSRMASERNSPVAEQVSLTGSLPQPPSERSETIGSDNVDTYLPQAVDVVTRDSSGLRREPASKERERHVLDDQDSKDRELRRHEYYDSRGQSPVRYREDRDLRRSYEHDRSHDSDDRRHYRRTHEDDRRGRRNRSYERSEDDADIEDYVSDRDRHERAVPREDYERYRRRGDRDRNRLEVHEKASRERQEHRAPGRERERRRQDYRDRPDYGREDYYGRYYEDDPYKRETHRSRPTSRSGSRPDYDDFRRQDYHGYGYNYYGRPGVDPYHYEAYYSYKYYENLRRTNPAAYAEWYAKYYGAQQPFQQGTFSEDRGSVHSGRSSANEERPAELSDVSMVEETANTTPQRLTPAKFMTAHAKGIWTTRGQLLKILPHCPLDGQPAVVDICDVSQISGDSDLEGYPGPLIKDITHKNSLIAFCSRKIKKAERDPELFDRESVILLWRLLILLLRQNGTVVGADIAELLLSSSSSSSLAGTPSVSQQSISESHTEEDSNKKCEEDITNQFREYLLYGNTKEALEWAMKYGLWGHALFLASKMDKRTHAQVMMRFANGLKMNDPLQTLYQLMSGRQPAAVTCCADEEWGDWKPHLAMILSNSTQRPELDHKAITTLGDTLGARGCLHAAHFCYLMAQLPFGIYSNKASKLVLIGSSHTKSFMEFATNEAIQMTEIYIYACQLANPQFELPQFEAYRLLYALRLAERGMVTEAIHYIEVLSNTILHSSVQYLLPFVKQVYEVGNLLKYSDPVYSSGEEELSQNDPVWLQELDKFIFNYGVSLYQHEDTIANMSSSEQAAPNYQSPNMVEDICTPVQDVPIYGEGWQQEQYSSYQEPQVSGWSNEMPVYEKPEETQQMPEQPEYWSQPTQLSGQPESNNFYGGQEPTQDLSKDWEKPNVGTKEKTEPGRPTSSIPVKPKQKKEPPKPVVSSSWFGGLWNKLTLRPKNQMKLPDDKNPSIVWNPEKNRWTNLDADDDDMAGDVPPPPKAAELIKPSPHVPDIQEPQNKYKMNRGRSLRANYVDVLGSSKAPPQNIQSELFPSMTTSQPAATYFVPAPADENAPTDFLTSSPVTQDSSLADATNDTNKTTAGDNFNIPPMYDPNSSSYPTASASRRFYPN